MDTSTTTLSFEARRAISQNAVISKYLIAVDHALLWVAALSFAGFFHVSAAFSKPDALLFSTLVAYGAYLCESGLETLKVAVGYTKYILDFRKAGMWRWIGLNMAVNTVLSLLFLNNPQWYFLVLIILTAGWQKYMDGRIPPRLKGTAVKLKF